MSQSEIITAEHQPDQASLKNYVIGFGSSLVLTLAAYGLVMSHGIDRVPKVALIVALALTQFIVQLVYFLHLGREFKPRWKLVVFGFMVTIVLILVGGSLWIMTSLNQRMSPAQMTTYMNDQDGL